MSNEIHNPSHRDFLKGVMIGVGGICMRSYHELTERVSRAIQGVRRV